MAPVKDNDDFSNRRMTRSAFKQASGSPENDPQQKKLGFSKQKQEGLSKKPRLSKKSRLSKTDDKQQEQQQQQQHRDGKDVKEVRRKTLMGEALLERHKLFKSWRLLTPEEAEIYSKKVTESEVDTRPVCVCIHTEFGLSCSLLYLSPQILTPITYFTYNSDSIILHLYRDLML